MIFKIKKYEFKKESVESLYDLLISNINYNLVLPANPIVDIEILKLHDKNLKEVIKILDNIILKKKYSYKTSIELIKLKQQIINLNLLYSYI